MYFDSLYKSKTINDGGVETDSLIFDFICKSIKFLNIFSLPFDSFHVCCFSLDMKNNIQPGSFITSIHGVVQKKMGLIRIIYKY